MSGAVCNPRRSQVPVWMMGLTNAMFGMYGGILVISVPQLLSARQVPEATIAAMTAVMISPGFWTFLVSPVLDVRFSRRWYAVVTAVVAAALLSLALLNLEHAAWVEGLLVVGFFFANLYQSALGGWLSSITTAEEKNALSVWVTIGNIGGGGAMAVITGEVLSVLKRREVLIAIVLFIAPAATFSLTNLLGGLGSDFHASTHFVGLVGGAGVLMGGITGCLIFPLINRRLPLRYLYLAIGMAGSIFTL